MNPSKHSLTVLAQIFKHIPRNLIPRLAHEYGVSAKCRSFSPNSHVLALAYAQLSHSISLNDVCDSLQNHSGALASIREAVPPSRNGLSHANRERNADMAEALFWEVFSDITCRFPGFGFSGRQYCGLPRRFKRTINVVDSSTIALVANCMDWAQHRHRKRPSATSAETRVVGTSARVASASSTKRMSPTQAARSISRVVS